MSLDMRNRANLLLRLLSGATMVIGAASPLLGQVRAVAPAGDTSAMGKPGALTTTETAVLNAMSDRNIVAHLMLADSSEAASSQFVSEVARDSTVASFAKLLATDHERALELDRALVPGLRGLPRLAAADTTDPRLLRMMDRRFRGLRPDSGLDRAFVSAQVLHHLHMLNELGTLRAIAMSAAVQRRIDSEIPVVRSHLARARALAKAIGEPTP